jgi:hypothetical protein
LVTTPVRESIVTTCAVTALAASTKVSAHWDATRQNPFLAFAAGKGEGRVNWGRIDLSMGASHA